MNNVIIVETLEQRRRVIQSVLLTQNMRVLGSATNGYEALQLVETVAADTVIMSTELPAISAIEVLELLNKRQYAGKTILIAAQPEQQSTEAFRRCGAAALIGEDNLPQDLPRAIDAVQDGYAFFPLQTCSDVVELSASNSPHSLEEKLSAQEHKVLQFLLRGLSNSEIAQMMGLSCKTVSTYKARVLQKTQARNLVELVGKLSPATKLY
ncbi:LuxR C-terminal-related transcriptional regulator [Pantoea sp. GM01]|uniref:LuxR C-terminal-related transcriptional regulator n=1 Tax=Pantoea sp. GM01 TaxID=1144320 RepID=UPI00027134D2|nr:LuxR C-terminal-related transcriptional regulator [Pantoea sp. GM01]EJL82576.1 response regulator containing a CheY-like receiver domain and an HTH DNA-binding domain [Pantoea sp. GM01]